MSENVADRLAAVEAVADRWDDVILECQQADPRWILDRSVTTLMTARDELRRALKGVTSPATPDPQQAARETTSEETRTA